MNTISGFLDHYNKLFKQHLYRNDCPKPFDPYKRLITISVITISGFHCIENMF